jgi:transposase InsO family protein
MQAVEDAGVHDVRGAFPSGLRESPALGARAGRGWSMASHMRSTLVVDALRMALGRQRPGPGLIHYSDQGGQYVSLAFGRAARQAGIAISGAGTAHPERARTAREQTTRPLAQPVLVV